ncbi:SE1832 family protein [Virgibacillus byunsanensis]|uniref:SE1832 family protein n=1 Tax=Virgibacillus byunsanensis TaxID=570945 RepID=A0ABW3LFZ5_9BACI
MTRKEIEAKLDEVKSDYVRIQSDMDKLEYVRGRVSSAEQQLIRLEGEMAELNKKLDAMDEEENE